VARRLRALKQFHPVSETATMSPRDLRSEARVGAGRRLSGNSLSTTSGYAHRRAEFMGTFALNEKPVFRMVGIVILKMKSSKQTSL
jgi:hypothetical protein